MASESSLNHADCAKKSSSSVRGVPAIEFVDDVAAFLKKEGDLTVEEGVKRLNETHSKYKLKGKIPELKNSLQILEAIEEKKANVMLEYSLEEARSLLERNATAAEKSVAELDSELDFVKDQLTTTEVNLARVYNEGVQRRKTETTAQK